MDWLSLYTSFRAGCYRPWARSTHIDAPTCTFVVWLLVKAGKACKIGLLLVKPEPKSNICLLQIFCLCSFACSFCSACMLTLNGSYLVYDSITWRPRSGRTNDSSLPPGHATQELRGLWCWFFSSSCKAYQERKGCTIEISLDLQDKDTEEGKPQNWIWTVWVSWCLNTLDHWAPTPTGLGQCSPFKCILWDFQTNFWRPPCSNSACEKGIHNHHGLPEPLHKL